MNDDLLNLDLDALVDEELKKRANPDPEIDPNSLDAQVLKQYGYDPSAGVASKVLGAVPPIGAGGKLAKDIVSFGLGQVDKSRKLEAIFEGLESDDPDPRLLEEKYIKELPRSKRTGELIGIDYTGGAGFEVQRDYEFLPTSLRNENSATLLLQNHYSEKYDIPRTFDFNVEVDPTGDGFVFTDPLDGKRKPLDTPGIDASDLAAFAEPLILEVGGALGGARLGGGPGLYAGTALGSFVWRYNNLNYLKEKYPLLFPEDFDITTRAIADAGLVTAFTGVGDIGFNLIRALTRTTGSIPVDKEAFERGFNKVKADYEKGLEQGLEEKTLIKPEDLTSAQIESIGKRPGDITMAETTFKERGLRSKAEAGEDQALADLYEEQAQKSQDILQSVVGTTAGRETIEGAQKLGSDIQAVVRQDLDKSLETPKIKMENIAGEADTAFRDLLEGNISPTEAGAVIKKNLEDMKQVRMESLDNIYANISKKNSNVLFNLGGNFKKLIQSEIKKEGSILFKDKKALQELQEVIEQIELQPNITYQAFEGTLKRVRNIKNRLINSGRPSDAMFKIEDELLNVRNRAFKNKKVDLSEIKKAEDDYAIFAQNYKKGVVNNILNSATDLAGYTKFMNEVLATSQAGGAFVRELLIDPAFADGLSAIKNGIKNAYRREVLSEADNLLKPKSPGAHEKFMQKYGEVINKYFDEDELVNFSNAENFASSYRRNLDAQRQIIKQIEADNALNIKILKENEPEKIFESVWSTGALSKNQALKKILDKYPDSDIAKRFKNKISSDLFKKVQDDNGLISSKKLYKYLDDNGEILEVWFGKEFTKTLDNVANQLEPFELYTRGGKQAVKDNRIGQAINQLARAYVGLFTMPGRFMTAVKQIASGATERRTGELLTDPVALQRVIERGKFFDNPVVRNTLRILSRAQERQDIIEPLPGGKEPERQPAENIQDILVEDFLNVDEDVDPVNMNRGGVAMQNELMPLKYSFGERS